MRGLLFFEAVLLGFPTASIYDLDIQLHVSCIIKLRPFYGVEKDAIREFIMKNITRFLMLVCIVLCTSVSAQEQTISHRKSVEERIAEFEKKKEAVLTPSSDLCMMKTAIQTVQAIETQVAKSPIRRALQTRAEEGKDIVLLDSVISDTHRAYYEYNEYGWLVAERIYNWSDGRIAFDAEESYCVEYDFDAQGRCTRYAQFLYNGDGSKGLETDRVTVEWTGERAHTERYYYYDDDEEWEGLELVEEIAYDIYGNPCLYKEYDWNSETEKMELDEFLELKFTGCAVVLEYDEDGYEIEFDEELMARYCCYYVSYDEYDGLYAYKIDTKEEGLTTTKTRYTIDLLYSDEDINLDMIDTYWEFAEEEVITLTPSRNRYASVYYYDRVGNDVDMPSGDNDGSVNYEEYAPATRAEVEKVLDASYVFEWDEYERLVKVVNTDYEGDVETYTCSYYNDYHNVISLAEFEKALLLHWEGMEEDDKCVMEGGFYGQVHKERSESDYGYGERVNDEYDANGNVLHRTYCEIYYSDVEAGKDLNGDGIMSTERSVANYEVWLTYDSDNNMTSYIEYCDTRDASRAYIKYVSVNEKNGNQYLNGWREYEGATKEGTWTLTFEEISVFDTDPAENPNVKAVGGWYRHYDRESQAWYGNKWEIKGGSYVEYLIDSLTGEFSITGYAPATRSDELQEGDHEIYFTEGDWVYRGNKVVGYVYDDEAGTEVLAVIGGFMEIQWIGESNGSYRPEHPAGNYEFPVGPYVGRWGDEIGMSEMQPNYVIVEWDMEAGRWRVVKSMEAISKTNHYTNEKGQIVNETKTYAFDAESERMVALPDVDLTIYSFDALNRLCTKEYPTTTVYYIYLNDDCNYLLESYSIDKASGAKYNVCKYYYSNGKYIPPYTNIEEVKATEQAWSVNGTSVIADGDIILYNMSGHAVARGNGVVVAPQNGLYIVKIGGTRAKIVLK